MSLDDLFKARRSSALSMAYKIVQYLGRLNRYEDTKIRIQVDSANNIDIYLLQGDQRPLQRVLSYSSPGATYSRFNDGKWVDYLEPLFNQATEVEQQQEEERRIQRERVEAEKWAPIDDAHLFPEVA